MSAPSDRARRAYDDALRQFESATPYLAGNSRDDLRKVIDGSLARAIEESRRTSLDVALAVVRSALNADFENFTAGLFARLSNDVIDTRLALNAALDEDAKEHLRAVARLAPQTKGETE